MPDCAMIFDWHTRTHRKENKTEYCSELLRVLLWTVLLFFVLLFFCCFFFFNNLEQSSQRFVPHRSGFFCAGMGMRDSVDWQVGSRHWQRTLL